MPDETARRFRILVVRLACRLAIARAANAAKLARAVAATRPEVLFGAGEHIRRWGV